MKLLTVADSLMPITRMVDISTTMNIAGTVEDGAGQVDARVGAAGHRLGHVLGLAPPRRCVRERRPAG